MSIMYLRGMCAVDRSYMPVLQALEIFIEDKASDWAYDRTCGFGRAARRRNSRG